MRETWRQIPGTSYSISSRNRVYNHEVNMMFDRTTTQIPADHEDRRDMIAAAEALVQMSRFVIVHAKK